MKQRIHIGLLFSETGPTAIIERTQLSATRLAIAHAKGELEKAGYELVAHHLDPQSEPRLFAMLGERLILEHGVKVLFGCYTSSSRKAALPVVEQYNRLLFYPTLYEGFEFSPNVVYTGACPNQNIIFLAEFMFSTFGTSCYLIGSDYVYPYETNRVMKDLVHGFGGRILGEQYVPLDATAAQFQPIIEDVRASSPDFVFSTVVGQATRHLYESHRSAELAPSSMPIASLTTTEAELATMQIAAREGHFTSAPFFASVLARRPGERWARLAAQAHGTPLNQCWEAAYFQLLMFANAVVEIGGDDPGRLIAALRGREFEAPQGRVRIDPDNNHTWVFPRIGRSRSDGSFEVIRESKRPVRPDPYLVSYAISAL